VIWVGWKQKYFLREDWTGQISLKQLEKLACVRRRGNVSGSPHERRDMRDGQTARGELIYSLDCKAIRTDYTVGENKPNMPPTNMKDTVIPKSGDVPTPATTPTTAAETK